MSWTRHLLRKKFRAGRVVVHLKSVIRHSSSTSFLDLQGSKHITMNILAADCQKSTVPNYSSKTQLVKHGKLEPRLCTFSTRLMYCRKYVRSAKLLGTEAHVASGSHWVIKLCCTGGLDPTIAIRIKGFSSGEGNNTDLKSQNTGTE